jgi:hypothetical protein
MYSIAMETTMSPDYRKAFPNFGILDVDLPPGFVDCSCDYEACPAFENLSLGLRIYVNYVDRSLWEAPETEARFRVWRFGPATSILLTDDWAEVLALVAGYDASNVVQFPRSGY